jgi:hypothetical protein
MTGLTSPCRLADRVLMGPFVTQGPCRVRFNRSALLRYGVTFHVKGLAGYTGEAAGAREHVVTLNVVLPDSATGNKICRNRQRGPNAAIPHSLNAIDIHRLHKMTPYSPDRILLDTSITPWDNRNNLKRPNHS